MRDGIITNFPSLHSNTRTDVVIMGGGISGALTAQWLCDAGFSVIIVDRRHAGLGSTVASTSLLQYEIDTPLHKLIEKVGKKNAVTSYLLGRDAIDALRDICEGNKKIFRSRPSFQFASFKKDVPGLEKEYTLRKEAGISLQWLDSTAIKNKFGFAKPAGLLSKDGAETDAYHLAHFILEKYRRRGLQVFDHTAITKISYGKKSVELLTNSNKKIKARWLVIACGYESQRYIPKKVETIHSTFAITSEPVSKEHLWYRKALIWETAQPYLYLRTTTGNRIIIGGKDVDFSDPNKRDQLLPQKIKALEKSFNRLFPSIPFKTDFAWAGSFASTKDGLPYIGAIPQRPHTYFALGFGGNGITFSIIAAQIIKDILSGKKNRHSHIFSFDR